MSLDPRARALAVVELRALVDAADGLAESLADVRSRLVALEALLADEASEPDASVEGAPTVVDEPGGWRITPPADVTWRLDPPPLSDVPSLDFPSLYAWQSDALEAWYAAGRVGVVEAVTGAGKTRLGLGAMVDALQRGQRVVIMTPTLALVRQWERQVRDMFPGVIVSTDAARRPGWHVLIDTVHTLAATDPLWRSEPALLVADEVHRYGAPTFSRALRPGFAARLGLTATYERGDDGDDVLRGYFREVRFTLGYGRALADGIIAPFRVAHVGIDLTTEERTEYDAATHALTRALWRLRAADDAPAGADFVDIMRYAQSVLGRPGHAARTSAGVFLTGLTRRREVLAGAAGKVDALRRLAPAVAASRGTIVFTQTTASARGAAAALQEEGCLSVAVHGRLDESEREERLELLRDGLVTSVSAPRLLDEGVDVPDCDLGIVVAASRSRRQMIQRLGRVLRLKDDGTPARFVVLHAVDTVEDPGVEEVPDYLADIVEHAAAAERFALPGDEDRLMGFLVPATSGGSRRAG